MTDPLDQMTTPSDPPASSPPSPVQLGRRPALLVAAVALLVLAADQGSKYLAVRNLVPGERTDLIGSLFGLRLTRNSGAAFSMATGYTWVLTIIATVVVIAIIRLAGRLASYGWALALGLLLGGALGNLTDRLLREPGFARGHVVDFLEFPHWPIFNIADCCVVSAAALIALLSLRGIGFDGQREVQHG
jgi:signal peptidase II